MVFKDINFRLIDLKSFVDKIDFKCKLKDISKIDYFKSSLDNNCWEWIACLDKDGYGSFRRYRAHRVSYYFRHGQISNTLLISHKCNNPKCVNPNHLVEDTNNGNMEYMVECDRSAFGEKHGRSTLKDSHIEEIIIDIINGCLKDILLDKYDISESQLYHILNSDTWERQTNEICKRFSITVNSLKHKIFGSYGYNINNSKTQNGTIIYQLLVDIHLNKFKNKTQILKTFNISRPTLNQILNGNSRRKISKKFELDYGINLDDLKNKLYNLP